MINLNIEIFDQQSNALIQSNTLFQPLYNYFKSHHILEIEEPHFYYLYRSELALSLSPYYSDTSVIPNNRFCNECWTGQTCKYTKLPTKMHDFPTIDQMRNQLNSEGVCAYQQNLLSKSRFHIGTHNDIFEDFYEQKFLNATLVFEDCHDLPLKLEMACSIHVTNRLLKNICQQMMAIQSQKWDQRFYQKNKLQKKELIQTQYHLNQKQFDILLPLVSLHLQIINYYSNLQGDQMILNPNQAGKVIQQCTQVVSQEQFINYFKTINIKINIDYLQTTYSCISYSNYEHYLDDIYQFTNNNKQLKHLFVNWIHLIKHIFDNIDYTTIENENENNNILSCPFSQFDKISVDKSIQSLETNDYNDYKCVILIDILQGTYSFSLICLNPAIGLKRLLNNGVNNIIIVSEHLNPKKIYKTELGIEFKYIDMKSPNKSSVIVINKTQYNIPIDFQVQNKLEQLSLDISKSMINAHQQLNEHGIIALFSSKSFMQQCQDVWSQHGMMQILTNSKDINWFKYPSKLASYDAIKQFINKCRFNSVVHDKMPAIYTHTNELFLDQLQQVIQSLQQKQQTTLQNISPITIFLIGVPWVCSQAYYIEQGLEQLQQINFDLKLEWVQAQKSKFDRKMFSLVFAIKTISRLQAIVSTLPQVNLIFIDDKFQWKQLWEEHQEIKITTFQDIIKELNNQRNTLIRTNHNNNQVQNVIKVKIQKSPTTNNNNNNQPTNTKRKIFLNKVLIGDYFNQNKKLQVQTEPQPQKKQIETEQNFAQIMGFTEQKSEQKSENVQTEEPESQCIICWGANADQPMQRSSKCGHLACQACWEVWLQTKLECPICRARVRQKFLIPQ